MKQLANYEGEKRLLKKVELCAYLGMGETSARKFADSVGATKKYGKSVFFDKVVLDKAVNDMQPK